MSTIVGKLQRNLKELGVNLTEQAAREIANDIRQSNRVRIHHDGKMVNGSQLVFTGGKSPREGAYSKSYAQKRRKKGRQINKVNLSFSQGNTGLEGSMLIARQGKAWVVKIVDLQGRQFGSAEIADAMEDMYKGQIWGITAEDQKVIDAIISKWVRRSLQ